MWLGWKLIEPTSGASASLVTSSVMARILSVRRPEFDGPDLIWSAGSRTCGRDGGDPDPATLLRASEDGKSHVTADTLDASHSEDDPGWLRRPSPNALLLIGDFRSDVFRWSGVGHYQSPERVGEPVSLLNFLDSLTAPLAQNVPSVISFKLRCRGRGRLRFVSAGSAHLPVPTLRRFRSSTLWRVTRARTEKITVLPGGADQFGGKRRTTSSRRCCFEVKQHDGS